MARTNKMWILKKKQQQAKQKGLTVWGASSMEGQKRSYTNPNWNEYTWFMRSGKWVSDVTSCREDPDGYRIRRKPSGWEVDFVHRWNDSRAYRRYIKRWRRASRI
jgi:hypothetical protein